MSEEMQDPFALLREPFVPDEIGWRVNRAGTKDGGEVWARVVPYIDARAIQTRFDDVFGGAGWQTDIRREGDALLVGIGVAVALPTNPKETIWVWKWDGVSIHPDDAHSDGTKTAVSTGFKRAAVQHGVGRYLYEVEEDFASITGQGRYYQPKSKKAPAFRWNPPQLPPWALPSSVRNQNPNNGTKTVEELKAEIDGAVMILADKLTQPQVDRVREGLESNNLAILHRTLDWLRSRPKGEQDDG